MVKKQKKKKHPQILVGIFVLLLSFMFVYPFWHTVVVSFADKWYAYLPGFKFWPDNISLEAYEFVFSSPSLVLAYANTIFRTVAGTLLTLVITFPIAYAMSHKDIPGASVINFLIVFTMFFSGGLIPTYLNLKDLHLLGTMWVLILPASAGAWNYIITRNYLRGISKEMEEAARIDGATVMQTMLKVILPLSKPVLAVIGLWSAVGYWNDWYDAMVYGNKAHLIVLQTLIQNLIEAGKDTTVGGSATTMVASAPETIRSATIVVATVPILLVYPFIQKYLVKGIMVGAVKG